MQTRTAVGREWLEEGTTIGAWRLEGCLGRGASGVVYAAVHELIGKRAAVKIIDPSLVSILGDRTLREARVVNQVRHPNIVDIFETGSWDDRPYLVMERLDGTSLASYLTHTKVLPDRAIAILLELCAGLAAAHAVGVVHRDLKPDNVFLVLDATDPLTPHVKIIDWGIAKPLADGSRYTREGDILGTPHYMSPEQACGRPVSPKSDVYALGIVAYELFVEQRPFEHASLAEVLRMQFSDPPPPPSELWPSIPPALESLMLDMLAKDPDARPSIDEVAQRLREVRGAIALGRDLVQHHAPATSPVAVAHSLPHPRRTRLARRGLLALVMVGSIAVIAASATEVDQAVAPASASAALARASVTAVASVRPLVPIASLPPSMTRPPPRMALPVPQPQVVRAQPQVVRAQPHAAPVHAVAVRVVAAAAPIYAADASNERVTSQYVAIGRRLHVADDNRIDVHDLWARFRQIRITDAYDSATAREHIARALTELEHDAASRGPATSCR